MLEAIAAHGATPTAVTEAGQKGVVQWLRDAGIRFQERTVERVLVWAANAASSDSMASTYSRVWQTLLEDWQAKQGHIARLERDLAGLLVQTPYILLLSHPGINVISAAELAGEMGPIENYASATAIKGRAGLFPSRYQSDQVDRRGNLSRFRNAKLRRAWMMVAANMVKCNAYWKVKAKAWEAKDVDHRDIRCRIANRLTATVFHMVSGKQLYRHPSRLGRDYVLQKLLTFHQDHRTPPHVIVHDLEQAACQIPKSGHSEEAKPVEEIYEKSRRSRRREPQPIGLLLVPVLARLGITDIELE